MSYERVTYRAPGVRRTRVVLLGDVRETDRALIGQEVDADGGTRWLRRGTTDRRHVIELGAVVDRQPLHMDLDLGYLVTGEGVPA